MKILTHLVRNIWKFVLIKIVKNLAFGLFFLLNNDSNSILACYDNAPIVVLFSASIAFICSSIWMWECYNNANYFTPAIAKLDYDAFINNDISTEDVRLAVLAKQDMEAKQHINYISLGLLITIGALSVFLMCISCDEVNRGRLRKNVKANELFIKDCEEIYKVLL